MCLGVIAENPIESLVMRLGLVPTPLLEGGLSLILARVVMAGVKVGVFDVLADKDRTAAQVSAQCGTDERATAKLLFALAAAGYLRELERNRYDLTPMSRRWLTRQGHGSLPDMMLLQYLHWDWLEHSEEFVRSGKPVAIHEALDDEGWGVYQRGVREFAVMTAKESTRRMPVPKGARTMLDIGGSHGYYSAQLCRRYDGLTSVILDLPQAVDKASPMLAAEGLGERVSYRTGNALTEDLGENQYDLVLVAALVHHFTEDENKALAQRVATALRPGGVYAIQDAFSAPTAREAGQPAALLDFFWALTSTSGTWAPEQTASWQRQAGLQPRRLIRFRGGPAPGRYSGRRKATIGPTPSQSRTQPPVANHHRYALVTKPSFASPIGRS